MKRLFFFFIASLLFVSCDNDSSNSAYNNVVTDDNTIPFEELLLIVNVKLTDNSYLVVKSIDSLNIFVNNYYWAKLNSESLDVSKVNKIEVDNHYETNKKIDYLVIANRDINQPDYTTAGDFAKYLNDYYELKPGEYACLIESFQVTFNDNTTKKYYPLVYKAFKIEEDSRSAFVGEIELNID